MPWRSRRCEDGAHARTAVVVSTSTKNPHCRDVIYVEELIGSETVNTLPLATQKAFLDHGRVHHGRAHGATIVEGWADPAQDLGKLGGLGIDLDAIAERLQVDGIESFAESYSKKMAALERKRESTIPAGRFSAGDLIKGS